MFKDKKNGKLFVFCGPSGVGKGTLLKKVRSTNPEIKLSVSATTRLPRPGEVHCRDYFFITKEEFETAIENDEFLEWAEFAGNYYGTPATAVKKALEEGQNIVLEIEVQGAMQIKNKIKDVVMIFILPPSFEELKARLKGRNTESEEVMNRRLSVVKEEIKRAPEFDYQIINGDFDVAVKELESVILKEIEKNDP